MQQTSFNLDMSEAIATGIGFAMGFGWLWFPSLQGFWLPDFLWGGVFDGGGSSLFCVLLLAGFFGSGLWRGKGRIASMFDTGGTHDFRLSRLPYWVHAVTLALVLVSMLPQKTAFGMWLYVPVAGMALAAFLQGIFWGGAILSLSSPFALASLAIAALVATMFGGLVSFLPFNSVLSRVILLLFAILASWGAAYILSRVLRIPRPDPKKNRGRPAKHAEQADNGELVNGEESGAAGSIAVFAAGVALLVHSMVICLLATQNLTLDRHTGSLCSVFVALGAALGLFCCGLGGTNGLLSKMQLAESTRFKRIGGYLSLALSPAKALSLAIGLCGLALVLPDFTTPLFALLFLDMVEGFISAVAVCVLAGPSSMPPLRKAAFALGVAFALVNLVYEASGIVALLPQHILATAIVVLALLLFAFFHKQSKGAHGSGVEPVEKKHPEPENREIADVSFTSRELEVLDLMRKDLSNRDIADALNVREVTVRFHLRNLYQKTGLTDRKELVDMPLPMPKLRNGAMGNSLKKQ